MSSDAVAVPVVSEQEFVGRALYFLGLANEPSERTHLRVYSLDLAQHDARVRVRIQSDRTGEPWSYIYDEIHQLQVQQKRTLTNVRQKDGSFVLTEFALRPLALELLLDPIYRAEPAAEEFAVSVTQASDGLRIWAFLSETNIVTQRVRISLPE